MSKREVKIFGSVDELNLFAAEEFARLAAEAIAARGKFNVALSGGSTPKKLYELLAADYKNKVDWRKVCFFWGDERLVAPDDKESNFRMADEALLKKMRVPKKNIHRYPTEKAVEFMKSDYPGCGFSWFYNVRQDVMRAAEKTEAAIRRTFELENGEFPRFDLILLGVGADGHTASLFPETEALEEREKIVAANYVPKFEAFRLTFTVPTINNARRVIFLAAGADKAEILPEILEGDAEKLPAQLIQPQNGELTFLLDEKAARKLAD